MKKALITTFSGTILATSILSPIAAASENKQVNEAVNNVQPEYDLPIQAPQNFSEDAYINSVLNDQNINAEEARQIAQAEKENRGKIGMTVKGAMEVIKKNKEKLQGVINSGIDKLPLSDSVKKHWKTIITVDALLEGLGHYTNLGDNVEGALTNALTDLGMPGWISSLLAKTITFAIPVL